jgi:hypothetical protein
VKFGPAKKAQGQCEKTSVDSQIGDPFYFLSGRCNTTIRFDTRNVSRDRAGIEIYNPAKPDEKKRLAQEKADCKPDSSSETSNRRQEKFSVLLSPVAYDIAFG